jgi:hypothetical protein
MHRGGDAWHEHSIWTEKISEGRVFFASRFLAKGIGRWNIRVCVRNPKCEGLARLEIAQLEVFAKRIFKSFIGRYWMYSLDSKFTFAPTNT